MNENRVNEINNALTVFGFSTLQETVFVLNTLISKGIEIEEFKEYVSIKQKNIENDLKKQNEEFMKQQNKWMAKGEKCPECQTLMMLYRVNTTTRDQVGGDYKSQWFCPTCYYDRYSNVPFEVVYNSIMN